jgi:hypothetical protein
MRSRDSREWGVMKNRVPVAFKIDIEATERREEFNHILRGGFGRRSRRNMNGLFQQACMRIDRGATGGGLAGKLRLNLGSNVNGDHYALRYSDGIPASTI